VSAAIEPVGHLGRRRRGGRPSRLQSAQLSDRILEVATTLFLSHGFGSTSIEAIAKRAGISKRTFYHRFRGKEVLFEAVVRRLIERWLPPFDVALLDAPNIDAALHRVAGHMLNVALTPEALSLHRIVIAEARQFPGLARILHELGAASAVERISRDFDRRVARGEIIRLDTRIAAEQFILMVVTGPQRRALGLGQPMSSSELATWIDCSVGLFLDGCRGRAH
jgi:AcrR family transcriptional regulator